MVGAAVGAFARPASPVAAPVRVTQQHQYPRTTNAYTAAAAAAAAAAAIAAAAAAAAPPIAAAAATTAAATAAPAVTPLLIPLLPAAALRPLRTPRRDLDLTVNLEQNVLR